MRESVGEWFTYNLIIIFIIIVFGLLTATLNYYKAFKVNARILDVIEKYEGYNSLAVSEIEDTLNSIGYTKADASWRCNETTGILDQGVLVGNDTSGNQRQSSSHYYCVYYHANDRGKGDSRKTNKNGESIYYNYSVVTYIFVDLPIAGQFKIPVRTKGERTYNFSH